MIEIRKNWEKEQHNNLIDSLTTKIQIQMTLELAKGVQFEHVSVKTNATT